MSPPDRYLYVVWGEDQVLIEHNLRFSKKSVSRYTRGVQWSYIASRLKAIPTGLWAALGAAVALFVLFARGRRLEAELAHAKLRADVAQASAVSASSEASAAAHRANANAHTQRAEELKEHLITMRATDLTEQKRLAALPPDEMTHEFLRLAARKKIR